MGAFAMAEFMDRFDIDATDDFPQQAPAVAQYQFLLRYTAHAAVRVIGFSWFPTVTPEGIIFTSISAADEHDVVGQSHLALIAIGAALAAFRLAAHRFGRTAEIAILPDPARPDIIACVTLGDFRDPSLDDCLRFNALTAPAARSPIDETRPLPQGLQHALPHLIARSGVWVSAVAAASDRMRVRDCLRLANLPGETADRFGAASVMRDELIGPRDLASPGLFLLGTQSRTPGSIVALGKALQELVVLLHMQEVHVRVARLSHALGERTVDALALPKVPQFMVEAAYRAPRRDR
jgi:hypothetical protein